MARFANKAIDLWNRVPNPRAWATAPVRRRCGRCGIPSCGSYLRAAGRGPHRPPRPARRYSPTYERGYLDQCFTRGPGAGAHQAVLAFLGSMRRYGWCSHLDIARYFPSVDLERLETILFRRLRDPDTQRLVRVLLDGGSRVYQRGDRRSRGGRRWVNGSRDQGWRTRERTQRRPRLTNRSSGWSPSRTAERRKKGGLKKEPPRTTRLSRELARTRVSAAGQASPAERGP
jgi:hypothetical protein